MLRRRHKGKACLDVTGGWGEGPVGSVVQPQPLQEAFPSQADTTRASPSGSTVVSPGGCLHVDVRKGLSVGPSQLVPTGSLSGGACRRKTGAKGLCHSHCFALQSRQA